jgi:hypothetical protein
LATIGLPERVSDPEMAQLFEPPPGEKRFRAAARSAARASMVSTTGRPGRSDAGCPDG